MMDFLAAHWHCILPLVGIAAYLLCRVGRTRDFQTNSHDFQINYRGESIEDAERKEM
jgi:hypothetical protein